MFSEIQCESPDQGAYWDFLPKQQLYAVGTFVTFYCSVGFMMVGKEQTSICNPEGIWDGLPQCECRLSSLYQLDYIMYFVICAMKCEFQLVSVIQCPSLDFLQNTTTVLEVTVDHFLLNGTVTFNCKAGYVLATSTSENELKCNLEGKWLGTIPECTRMNFFIS